MAIESDVSNADTRLAVQFYTKPVHNAYQSELQGRPIYEDVDYVKIFVPGDSTLVVDTPVRDDHKARFPRHWAHYQSKHGGDAKEIGTPINQWPLITPAQAEELRALKFYTVESVANAADAQLQRIGMLAGMSPFVFRDRAKNYLAVAAGEAIAHQQDEKLRKLEQEKAATDERLRQLEAQLQSLAERQAHDEPERRRGRPPKIEQEAA